MWSNENLKRSWQEIDQQQAGKGNVDSTSIGPQSNPHSVLPLTTKVGPVEKAVTVSSDDAGFDPNIGRLRYSNYC